MCGCGKEGVAKDIRLTPSCTQGYKLTVIRNRKEMILRIQRDKPSM